MKTEDNTYLYEGFINEVKGSLNTGVSEEVIEEQFIDYMNENPVVSEVIYSTEEQVIGKWINDKPLYKRTFESITASNDDYGTLVTLDKNIDNVLAIYGYVVTSDKQVPINNYIHEEHYVAAYYDKTKNTIQSKTSSAAYRNKTAYVTIEYTKAAD